MSEEKKELSDWVAQVKVADRARKVSRCDFVNSEAKAEIGAKMRRLERQFEEDELTENTEYGTLKERLTELDEADERVSWVDELEVDQVSSEAEVEVIAITHYFKTWNNNGRNKYKGQPRYDIDVQNIQKRLIQVPRIALP